jgi:hypothetical protein
LTHSLRTLRSKGSCAVASNGTVEFVENPVRVAGNPKSEIRNPKFDMCPCRRPNATSANTIEALLK